MFEPDEVVVEWQSNQLRAISMAAKKQNCGIDVRVGHHSWTLSNTHFDALLEDMDAKEKAVSEPKEENTVEDDRVKRVRSVLEELCFGSANAHSMVRAYVAGAGVSGVVLAPDDLRAFLDATKPPEPKRSEVLDEIADDLIEARRYVRTSTKEAYGQTHDALDRLKHFLSDGSWDRFYANICFGLDYIQVDPEVLEGYLYAAAFEIRGLAEKARKAEGKGG